MNPFPLLHAPQYYHTHQIFICHYKILPKPLTLELLSTKPKLSSPQHNEVILQEFQFKISARRIYHKNICVIVIRSHISRSIHGLPFLSFNKSSNCLHLKFLSLPMLSLIFYSALSVTWIGFYVIQNTVIMSAGSNKKASNSATVSSTYLGIMALATFCTSATRVYCVIKYKEIICFYEPLKSTISNVLVNSPKARNGNELAYWSSKMNAKGCCTPIQITISVSIIFIVYALRVVVFQIGNQKHQSTLWQWFEAWHLFVLVLLHLYTPP